VAIPIEDVSAVLMHRYEFSAEPVKLGQVAAVWPPCFFSRRSRLSETTFILPGKSGNWKYLDNEHEGGSMVLAWQSSPMVCRFTQRGCFAFRPGSTSRRMTLNPGPHLLEPCFG